MPNLNILSHYLDYIKYLFDKIALNGYNMLVSGETGVGKSVIINEAVYGLDK